MSISYYPEDSHGPFAGAAGVEVDLADTDRAIEAWQEKKRQASTKSSQSSNNNNNQAEGLNASNITVFENPAYRGQSAPSNAEPTSVPSQAPFAAQWEKDNDGVSPVCLITATPCGCSGALPSSQSPEKTPQNAI